MFKIFLFLGIFFLIQVQSSKVITNACINETGYNTDYMNCSSCDNSIIISCKLVSTGKTYCGYNSIEVNVQNLGMTWGYKCPQECSFCYLNNTLCNISPDNNMTIEESICYCKNVTGYSIKIMILDSNHFYNVVSDVNLTLCFNSTTFQYPYSNPNPFGRNTMLGITEAPTTSPTTSPTDVPTTEPSAAPSPPTDTPSVSPTNAPSSSPTTAPTVSPTSAPSSAPTSAPSKSPSVAPTPLMKKRDSMYETKYDYDIVMRVQAHYNFNTFNNSRFKLLTRSKRYTQTQAPTGEPTTKSPTSAPTFHVTQAGDPQLSFNIPTVTITFTDVESTDHIFISWSYNNQNGWVSTCTGIGNFVCNFPIDYTIFLNPGTLIVKVFLNDDLRGTAKFVVGFSDSCITINYYDFHEVFSKWPCVSSLIKFLICAVIIIICIVFLILLYLIAKCVLCCLPCCYGQPGVSITNLMKNSEMPDEYEMSPRNGKISPLLCIFLIGCMIPGAVAYEPHHYYLTTETSETSWYGLPKYYYSTVEVSNKINESLPDINCRLPSIFSEPTLLFPSFIAIILLFVSSYQLYKSIKIYFKPDVAETIYTISEKVRNPNFDYVSFKFNRDLCINVFGILICLWVISSIPVVKAQPVCSNGVVLSNVLTTCVVSGSTETCSFMTDTLVVLPFLGGVSCLTYQSPGSETVLGVMTIEYLSSLKHVSLNHNYYTSPFVGEQVSVAVCHNSYGCSDNECSNFNFTVRGGYLSDVIPIVPAISYPGVTKCNTQPGCISNSCVDCGPKCIYSRAAYRPIAPFGQVMSPFDISIEPIINVTFYSDFLNWTQTVSLASGEVDINENISISVTGSLTPSLTEFGSRKLIINGNNIYLGAACESNAPCRGIPGDIQASSIVRLSSPTLIDPIFAPDLTTPNYGAGATIYSYASPGFNILNNGQYLALPALIGSTLYTYNSGQLLGVDNQPGAVLVTIFNSQPVIISKKVSVVCPILVSVAITGCYSCLGGGQFKLVAHSTCNPGSVTVGLITNSNMTLSVFSIVIGVIDSEFLVPFISTDKYVIGQIFLKSGARVSTLGFQTALNDPQGIVLVNESFPPGWVFSAPGPDFNTWWNNLSGFDSVFRWIVIAAVSVIVLIGVGLLTWWFLKKGYPQMLIEKSYVLLN